MTDLGIELVKEFHKIFGASIGEQPEVPKFSSEYSEERLYVYQKRAAALAEQMKEWAVDAKANGDTAGSLLLIRLQLIQEELAELAEGMLRGNIISSFDALLDLSYVVDGTYITLGLHDLKSDGLREVHRSNMSKLGADGRPIISDAGRVVKGPNYSPPNLEKVLRQVR